MWVSVNNLKEFGCFRAPVLVEVQKSKRLSCVVIIIVLDYAFLVHLRSTRLYIFRPDYQPQVIHVHQLWSNFKYEKWTTKRTNRFRVSVYWGRTDCVSYQHLVALRTVLIRMEAELLLIGIITDQTFSFLFFESV